MLSIYPSTFSVELRRSTTRTTTLLGSKKGCGIAAGRRNSVLPLSTTFKAHHLNSSKIVS
jgi:hypothetical protein